MVVIACHGSGADISSWSCVAVLPRAQLVCVSMLRAMRFLVSCMCSRVLGQSISPPPWLCRKHCWLASPALLVALARSAPAAVAALLDRRGFCFRNAIRSRLMRDTISPRFEQHVHVHVCVCVSVRESVSACSGKTLTPLVQYVNLANGDGLNWDVATNTVATRPGQRGCTVGCACIC